MLRAALAKAAGGATFVLNMRKDWETNQYAFPHRDLLIRARDELGVRLARIEDWEQLVKFARDFARTRVSARASQRPRERRHDCHLARHDSLQPRLCVLRVRSQSAAVERTEVDADTVMRLARLLSEYQSQTGDSVMISWLGGEPLLGNRSRRCRGFYPTSLGCS